MFTKLEAYLKGKKTYAVAVALAAYSLLGVFAGDLSFSEFVRGDEVVPLLEALGLSSLRAGIAKK